MTFPGRARHAHVTLDHPVFGAVEIDQNIAPLIAELWAADIWTLGCCEASDAFGRAWIGFATPNDAQAFLDALDVDRDERNRDSLYQRIGDGWLGEEDWDNYDESCQWNFTVLPDDLSYGDMDAVEFGFRLSAFFPPSDIPELVERMRRHNRPYATDTVRPALPPGVRAGFDLVDEAIRLERIADDDVRKAA